MKITFLGTSHGRPEGNRRCACTMLEIQNNIYFVDMGMMPQCDLINRGLDIARVKGIFFTHMHGDHTDGLPSFLSHLTWAYTTADPTICLPQLECVEVLRSWIQLTCYRPMRDFQFRQITPGLFYDDGILKVTAIPTSHCPSSHALLLEAEGKRILFTGDLKHPSVDFPLEATAPHTHLLVAEIAHFPITAYPELLQNCPVDTVLFNHYSPRNTDHYWQTQEALKPKLVRLTTDGFEYTL